LGKANTVSFNKRCSHHTFYSSLVSLVQRVIYIAVLRGSCSKGVQTVREIHQVNARKDNERGRLSFAYVPQNTTAEVNKVKPIFYVPKYFAERYFFTLTHHFQFMLYLS